MMLTRLNLKLLLIPYIYIVGSIIKLLNSRNYHSTQKKIEKKKGIAIVTICKNEADYILEWIAYHKICGIKHIYLYDNGSTDDTIEKIKSIFNDDFVTVTNFPGNKMQYAAYNNALKRYGNNYKYMAFIDCDEFIMPQKKGSLIERSLDEIIDSNSEIGGVGINWCVFGSSGLKNKTKQLLLEKFLHRGDTVNGIGNACIKSIVIPERVSMFNHPHYPVYKIGYYGVNLDGEIIDGCYSTPKVSSPIRINHYFTKSLEEWIERRSRGRADIGVQSKRTIEEFYQHDDNSCFDDSSLEYIEEIKTIIGSK